MSRRFSLPMMVATLANRVAGQSEVQRWTRVSYSATRVLVFDRERLKSIE